VEETASYGQLSFESLSSIPAPGTPEPAPNPTGQPQPLAAATLVPKTSQSILYGASETSVGSALLLRPWTVLSRVGYQLTGGVDSAAQQYLPFQQGSFAETTADYKLYAYDHVATVASGSETSFSAPANTEDVLAQIEEQWRHRWARKTETLLGVGWYVARTRAGLDQPDLFASNPVAEAAVDQRYVRGANQAELRLDVRLAPFINRLTGLVDEQIRGVIEGTWTHRRLKLRAFASAAESVDQGTATSARYGTAELDAAYRVSEWLTFDGGVRALYQEQNGPSPAGSASPFLASTLSQGVVFVAVTVHAIKARF
jgi:hypothetical protein